MPDRPTAVVPALLINIVAEDDLDVEVGKPLVNLGAATVVDKDRAVANAVGGSFR
ncbi:hypothetical protein TanjilG_05688 [Lupinus angustifolius]|uniref:Uncharacterized protein n=1 Tax=Lupinus angustifolius TaxID=3871 RepID=A0A4P1QT57_LUPAN|nr:hypothetical protein TanjilG_05688 [Lupinus angustifolius]